MTIIPGATNPTFVLTTDQFGQRLFCKVTAQNDFGIASQNSNIVGPVTNPAPAATTWNPADKTTDLILSGSNLVATNNGSGGFTFQAARGTISHNTGKKYFETTLTNIGNPLVPDCNVYVGLGDTTFAIGSTIPGNGNGKGFTIRSASTNFIADAETAGWYPSPDPYPPANGVVVGLAVDLDARKAFFAFNGVFVPATLHGGNDPVTGAGGLAWGSTAEAALFPFVGLQWGATVDAVMTANFGSIPFVTAPLPTGYVAWG